MNKIIEVAKNAKEITKSSHEVFCPWCNEKQWSIFDKFYTKSYGSCVDCEDTEKLTKRSEDIFNLIKITYN